MNKTMRRMTDNSKMIKCRGKNIKTYPVGNSETLTIGHFDSTSVYFSLDQPFAIKYRDRVGLMTFEKLGEITMTNKILLRKHGDYRTVMEIDFNAELYRAITKTN